MRSSKVGPIPVLSGLQLQPAEGKPTGLLRALNIEPRDGLAQTRRGCSVHAGFTSTAGWTAGAVFPATWNGQTVTYVGLVNSGYVSDRIVQLELTGTVVAADEVVDEEITWEFWGEDDAWHSLSVINITNDVTGYWWGATKKAHLTFIHPYGWKNAQPAGTPSSKQWLRATKSTAWVAAHAVGCQHRENTLSALTARAFFLAPSTRAARGPFVVAPYVSGASAYSWAVIDISRLPDGGNGEALFQPGVDTCDYISRNSLTAALSTGFQADDNEASAVYVPASDELMVSVSGKYIRVDCSLTAAQASSAANFTADTTAAQYVDIALETALPAGATAMTVFGQRVFIGGFAATPQRLQWSAPGGFWRVWPTENIITLAGGGSGAIRALMPIADSLFIFTSTAIWRALLGDPGEGAESSLFVDLVEETPCVSRRSVVAAGRFICFLSEDGPRVFDGRKSRPVGAGVRDLFRPDSEHPLAAFRKSTSVGAWHKVENQYRMAYSSPAAGHNETVLVVDLDDGTSWLWGSDPTEADSIPTTTKLSYLKARPRSIRVAGWVWDERSQTIVAIDPEGYMFRCDRGYTDLKDKIPWYMESQTLGIGEASSATLTRVDAQVQIDNYQTMKVVAIPDGDEARGDSKTIAVQRGPATQAALDSSSLASSITPSQQRAAIAPVTARFRKTGRNHRVRLESVSPHHAAIKLLALTVETQRGDEPR